MKVVPSSELKMMIELGEVILSRSPAERDDLTEALAIEDDDFGNSNLAL